MTFRVVITTRAERDQVEIAEWIGRDSPMAAIRWLDDLAKAFESLSDNAHRFPLAIENEFHAVEIRHLIFGVYRVLFTVDERTVTVLHVRHGAQLPAQQPDDLER